MAGRQHQQQRDSEQELERAVTAVSELVERAVAATVADRSPDPARETVELIDRMDSRAGDAEAGSPITMLATLTLVARLATARDALAGRAGGDDGVGAALDWVAGALGKRCRARAGFVRGLLVSEEAADDVLRYREALRGEFLPALIWLLAGVTAVHGDLAGTVPVGAPVG